MDKKKTFLTTKEAAEALSVSVTTIQKWCEEGLLKSWKTTGGHRRLGPTLHLYPPPGSETGGAAEKLLDEILLKVLIVEDNNVLLRLYQLTLESWGLPIEFTFATNACDALLTIGRESSDLLIADLTLEGSEALQTLRDLARSHLRRGIEIVVVTGMGQDEINNRGGLPSEISIYQKPIPFEALRTICADMLQRRRKLSSILLSTTVITVDQKSEDKS